MDTKWVPPPCGLCQAETIIVHEDYCHLYQPPLGWRCPVCGRGLAPDVKECSCVRHVCGRVGLREDCLVCNRLDGFAQQTDVEFDPIAVHHIVPPEA